MSQVDKLNRMQQDIQERRDSLIEAKGKFKAIRNEMKEKFGVSTVAAANKLIEKFDADSDKLQEGIDALLAELKEEFEIELDG